MQLMENRSYVLKLLGPGHHCVLRYFAGAEACWWAHQASQRGDCYNCPVTMSRRRVWAARLCAVAAFVQCARLSRCSCSPSDTGSSQAPSCPWQNQRWHQGCEGSHQRWRWYCQLKWLSHPHDDVTSGYIPASLSLVIVELQLVADHPGAQLSNAGDSTLLGLCQRGRCVKVEGNI